MNKVFPTNLMRYCLTHIALVTILVSCGDAPSGSTYDQVGYYKGDNKSRVFSYRIPRDAKRTEVNEHGNKLMWTKGRITVACYWHNPPYDAKDAVTGAPSMEVALARACGERSGGHKPLYQFRRSPNDGKSLVTL